MLDLFDLRAFIRYRGKQWQRFFSAAVAKRAISINVGMCGPYSTVSVVLLVGICESECLDSLTPLPTFRACFA